MRYPGGIEQEIEERLSRKEVERYFEAGKSRKVTLVNAIFLDGKSVESGSFRSVVLDKRVRSIEDFDALLLEFTNVFTGAADSANQYAVIALRACAKAGLMLASQYIKGPDAWDMDAMKEASAILGTALTAESEEELLNTFGLPDEVQQIFERYVESAPWPALGHEWGKEREAKSEEEGERG